jgi:hypothetical protein
MLCRQRTTAAKVVRALSKTMTTPNGQQQRLFRVVMIKKKICFFFKVQQEFVQEFACDQSWIVSFGVFQVAPT